MSADDLASEAAHLRDLLVKTSADLMSVAADAWMLRRYFGIDDEKMKGIRDVMRASHRIHQADEAATTKTGSS